MNVFIDEIISRCLFDTARCQHCNECELLTIGVWHRWRPEGKYMPLTPGMLPRTSILFAFLENHAHKQRANLIH